ncbi:hypothetical protein AB0O07_23460 [Streptomyces sp. NPDC093085]|uniref:hypothetical protein n=1 Tax=Streptomyces sp. NPDC093085 TaxID=3155068 RepID=UPI0034302A70
MAWDEWEQAKADAAGRQAVAMRLNQVPADQGASASEVTGGLKTSKKAWTTAGEGVGSLRTGIGTALTKLEDGQSGLGATTGCLSAAAQKEVYDSWKAYAKKVSGRCGSLQSLLERVGNDQLRTDESVKSELDQLKKKYADTPAVGGQTGGHTGHTGGR